MLNLPSRFKIRVNADNIKRILDVLRRCGYEWVSGRKLELRRDFQYTTVGLIIDHHKVGRFTRNVDYLACSFNEMSISQLFASVKTADVSEDILSLF